MDGLDCANCASKIETKVKSISGVKSASVDFISKKLTLELNNKHELNGIMQEVKDIVKKIEPDYLEALNNVDIVVFDKTGTLTKGVFKVTEINAQNGVTKDELLEYAAYAESYSNHPIATSIIKEYGKEINKNEINNYDEISGHGIKVNAKGREILAGNIKLMNKENIPYKNIDAAETVVHIAIDRKYAGYIYYIR